jgi:hypothetical protein
VTVTGTAVALNTASTAGQTLVIMNHDATPANGIDLGAAGVTAGTGGFLAGGNQITIYLQPHDVLYAIRSTGNSVSVSVLRT